MTPAVISVNRCTSLCPAFSDHRHCLHAASYDVELQALCWYETPLLCTNQTNLRPGNVPYMKSDQANPAVFRYW